MTTDKKEKFYSKELLSETDSKDISHHGSPTWEYFQTINYEDKTMRENIIKNFALKTSINSHYWNGEAEGFDGKQNYIFRFFSEFPKIEDSDREKNINYFSGVAIKKAGDSEEIKKFCDLELFLLSEGFTEEKK